MVLSMIIKNLSRDNMSIIIIAFPAAPKVDSACVKIETELSKFGAKHPFLTSLELEIHSLQVWN